MIVAQIPFYNRLTISALKGDNGKNGIAPLLRCRRITYSEVCSMAVITRTNVT
jgi:hypothetical protein